MGKQGPCCHCGVTSTPLWRNGPPEKPVLCNACGTRWRTRHSLTKYVPLHTRGSINSEGLKTVEVKSVTSIPLRARQQKLPKKKKNNDVFDIPYELPFSGQNFQKIAEGDPSNRSSSTSAISYSGSCAQYGTAHVIDLSGSSKSDVLVSLIPSKKRTSSRYPKPSPVEKLARDLCSIMHEQQSSCTSGTWEEDLIYQDGAPIDSFETGYGSVLLRHPNSETAEEESEASSVPVTHRSYVTTEAYLGSAAPPVNFKSDKQSFSNADSNKLHQSTTDSAQDTPKRNKYNDDMLQILQDKDSPLALIDLKDIVNFENFLNYFTTEEQQQLLKFLPSVDTESAAASIKSMFSTPQFAETLCCFQKLLQEDAFGLSFLQANAEECWRLKGLLLGILNKSRWVEFYGQLKDKNCKQVRGEEMVAGSDPGESLKRPHDGQTHSSTDLIDTMRSPKRVCKPRESNLLLVSSSEFSHRDAASKHIGDDAEFIDTKGTSFSQTSLFKSPPDWQSMLAPVQYTDDSCNHGSLQDSSCKATSPKAGLRSNRAKKNTNAGSDNSLPN